MAKICIKKQLLSAKWMISYDFTASYKKLPPHCTAPQKLDTKLLGCFL